MNKLILHIPHSSKYIPADAVYMVDQNTVDKEILKLTDWYTDDLFSSNDVINVKAEFSRVFCDPERFSEDSQEVMAQFGMGVLYEKSDEGIPIREVNPNLREAILNRYYWPHHKQLNQAVEQQLKTCGKALIVDCHSFPSTPFVRDLDQSPNRPDFNIGIDPYHTPESLTTASREFFEHKGYTVGIDWPYKGTIVPLAHYQKSKNVASIMLEINRSLYLDEPSNVRSVNYAVIKSVVNEFLELMKSHYDQAM
jgi:N-formylglutamate deformylase